MRENRRAPRPDQVRFRAMAVGVGLLVATYFLVCLAMVG